MKTTTADLIIGQRLDIQIKEADDFNLGFDVKNSDDSDFDFTGYSMELVVKIARSEDLPVVFRILSGTVNPGILLTTGNINIAIPKSLLSDMSGTYVYDLTTTKDDFTETWAFGNLTIVPKAY